MILAIHQPQYIPWLGYFDKMDRADIFCYLDNVQYKKNEWQNRNRIKTANGWQWLTVPVQYKFPQKINEVKIDPAKNWKHKHLQSLMTNYQKSRYFKKFFGIFEETFSREWVYLSELNIYLIEKIKTELSVDTRTIIASQFHLSDDPSGRLIDICKQVGADTYLAGKEGANYMDMALFEKNNIRVIFQDFRHPIYPQLFGDFQSHLSIVDLLFGCGHESMNRIRTHDC